MKKDGMANNQETACYTWPELAKLFNFSLSKVQSLRPELEEAGVIFHTKRGIPYRNVIGFFPSIVKAWTVQKAAKGERIGRKY